MCAGEMCGNTGGWGGSHLPPLTSPPSSVAPAEPVQSVVWSSVQTPALLTAHCSLLAVQHIVSFYFSEITRTQHTLPLSLPLSLTLTLNLISILGKKVTNIYHVWCDVTL